MKMYVEYNTMLNDIAHKMMLVPINYWCHKNVSTIVLSVTDDIINMSVLLKDGHVKSFEADAPSGYKYYYDTDSLAEERTKLANEFREDVKKFSLKNDLNKKFGKGATMGKAIANKKGFMVLCDNMDLLTSQLGPDNVKLMRFENNEAIMQVFDREVVINLDDAENMGYKQLLFKIAEEYSDEAVNKESES